MTATTSTFKRGDTFMLGCTYKVNGRPTAITTQTFKSQLRSSDGTLVASLVATIDPNQTLNPGKFYLAPADQSVTKTWTAPDTFITDIEISDGGVVTSTENIIIPIELDQTV